jgi:hypothetical protein
MFSHICHLKIYNNDETTNGNKKNWQTLHKLWMRQTQCKDVYNQEERGANCSNNRSYQSIS